MSSHLTENYGLHTWEPEDTFLRTEFNENFAAIDGAIHGAVVAGSYVGDGVDGRTIALGFTPRAVLAYEAKGTSYENSMVYAGLFLEGQPMKNGAAQVVEGGFSLGVSTYNRLNSNNYTYYYVAFR